MEDLDYEGSGYGGGGSNNASGINASYYNYSQSAIAEVGSSKPYFVNVTTDIETERMQDILYLSLYSATFLAALLGNSIVCSVVFGKPSMKNFTNILLANMAISDIFCAIMFPVGLLICWDNFINYAGHHACLVAKVIQLLSFQVSSVTMTIVAMDRFMLVHYPLLRQHRFLPVYVVIVGIWIISLILIAGTSPSLAFHRYFTPDEAYIKCEVAVVFGNRVLSASEQRVRLVIANLAHFWIPLTVIFVCYASITVKVLKRNVGSMTSTQEDALLRAKWKTIKMLIAAVAMFFLCWFPFFILNLIDFIANPERKRPCNKSGLFFLAVWIAFTSCCWNPFVYWIYSEDFRGGLKDFGRMITPHCYISSRMNDNDSHAHARSKSPPKVEINRSRTITLSSQISDEP